MTKKLIAATLFFTAMPSVAPASPVGPINPIKPLAAGIVVPWCSVFVNGKLVVRPCVDPKPGK